MSGQRAWSPSKMVFEFHGVNMGQRVKLLVIRKAREKVEDIHL